MPRLRQAFAGIILDSALTGGLELETSAPAVGFNHRGQWVIRIMIQDHEALLLNARLKE